MNKNAVLTLLAGVAVGVAAALVLRPAPTSPTLQGQHCRPHELDVIIRAEGTVPSPGDAEATETCYFVVNVNNQSSAPQEVSMALTRPNPGGGPPQDFDICVGRQLKEPRSAPPGSRIQIACYIRPGLVAGLPERTHPRDKDDAQGQPLERGFKYTLKVGTTIVDPDLVIKR